MGSSGWASKLIERLIRRSWVAWDSPGNARSCSIERTSWANGLDIAQHATKAADADLEACLRPRPPWREGELLASKPGRGLNSGGLR